MSCRSHPPASSTWVRPKNPPGVWNDRQSLRQPTRAETVLRAPRSRGAARQIADPRAPPAKHLHLLRPRTCDAAGVGWSQFADDGIGPGLSFDHPKALALDHLGGSDGNDVAMSVWLPPSGAASSAPGVMENQHPRVVHRGTKGSNPPSLRRKVHYDRCRRQPEPFPDVTGGQSVSPGLHQQPEYI